MNNIDFLPSSYQERRLRVRLWLWRFAVLAGFGMVVCSVAVIQVAQHRRAKQRLTQMHDLRLLAEKKSENLSALQKQLKTAREFADLYTYLAHPWPRTQLLSAIAKPLPPSMCLSELAISRTSKDSDQRRSRVSLPTTPDSGGQDERPARLDLDRLRTARDRTVSTVQLVGETSDTTDVHHYVAALEASPLFTLVELESLESVPSQQPEPSATFHIRLVVRQGYGQPGGPHKPPPALASTRHRNAESTLP